jgi:formylmethanofuran dehydrogenase subunit E
MTRLAQSVGCCVFVLLVTALCPAEEAKLALPEPDYRPLASDPAWLAQTVQFHGHLGPTVVAGARLGMAGLRAIGAKGYFDVEVTCQGPLVKPPQSCFLDGLQVATGATLGKRSLHWTEAAKIVVRVTNTQTGKVAEVRPTPLLMELLGSLKPRPKAAATSAGQSKEDEVALEAIARKIATLPDEKLLSVRMVSR